MAAIYATIADFAALWRPLTDAETVKVNALIPIVCAEIRTRAKNAGRDFDEMLREDSDLKTIAASVVVDVVRRYINDSSSEAPSMSQMSQAVGGYSVSGTYLVPGGGLF